MNAYNLLLVINSPMLVTAVAAAKWPLPGYRLMAVVAACAFISALDQVVTGRGSPSALLFTAIPVALVTWRAALNARGLRR